MSSEDIRKSILRVVDNLNMLSKEGIDSITGKRPDSLYSFSDKRRAHYLEALEQNVLRLKESVSRFRATGSGTGLELSRISEGLDAKTSTVKALMQAMERMSEVLAGYQPEESAVADTGALPHLVPEELKDEVMSDISEAKKCFSSGCYRSVAIICGRLLELALHRKHFEQTGTDLLEKSPGIGLGKIVAKLSEQGIGLDPGLSQQIHLINQVRVFSVHVKKRPFNPSRSQAHAMLLYTFDVLEKIFSGK